MDEDTKKLYRILTVLSTVGLVIVFATVIGVYIGFKLDGWLNTSPWFTIIFFLFGIVAGFKNLFNYAKRIVEGFNKDEGKKNGQ